MENLGNVHLVLLLHDASSSANLILGDHQNGAHEGLLVSSESLNEQLPLEKPDFFFFSPSFHLHGRIDAPRVPRDGAQKGGSEGLRVPFFPPQGQCTTKQFKTKKNNSPLRKEHVSDQN
jgi:hypothetical protein